MKREHDIHIKDISMMGKPGSSPVPLDGSLDGGKAKAGSVSAGGEIPAIPEPDMPAEAV